MARELADILAEALVNDLRSDILKRLSAEPIARGMSRGRSDDTQDLGVLPSRKAEPRSLWTLRDLAQDSSIKVSTWRRWILERHVPVVRIGRSIRIKDEDYRKLIQKGYRKAIIAGPIDGGKIRQIRIKLVT